MSTPVTSTPVPARSLDTAVVIITGAAHGIGAAYARALSRDGAAVVIADLDEPGAVALADELRA